MRQVLTRPGKPVLLLTTTSSEVPVIACSNLAFLLLMAHVIPAAAIKQNAPPTAAPITILGLVFVESELSWLDSAAASSNHGQESSRISVSRNITEF
jgi:hypothetical protein